LSKRHRRLGDFGTDLGDMARDYHSSGLRLLYFAREFNFGSGADCSQFFMSSMGF
jgi:hypothetical protein